LSLEIAALDGIRQALARKDANEALRRIVDYEAEFPSGVLGAEAAALRIQALVEAGRRSEARAELASFRRYYPTSPLLDALAKRMTE
jgi:outer membrane protein assembly factor BamD (BamD/ComL family)